MNRISKFAALVAAACTILGSTPTAKAQDGPNCDEQLASLATWAATLPPGCVNAPPADVCKTLCEQSGGVIGADKGCSPTDANKDKKVRSRGNVCVIVDKGKSGGVSGDKPKPPSDMDGDGVSDAADTCPTIPNGRKQEHIPFVGGQKGWTDKDGKVHLACQPEYLVRVAAILDASEELLKIAQANDIGTPEKLNQFIVDLKALLARKAVGLDEWNVLVVKFNAFQKAMMGAFACLEQNQLPSFAAAGTEGKDADGREQLIAITVVSCHANPAFDDVAAAVKCTQRGKADPAHPRYFYWVSTLDAQGSPTGRGECREDRVLTSHEPRIVALEGDVEGVKSDLRRRLSVGSATEFFGQAYPDTGYGAYGVRQSLTLGLNEHWSVEGNLAFGLAAGENAPDEGKAVGGGFSFHHTTGSRTDGARFDIGLGVYGMDLTDPRFHGALVTYGGDAKPAVMIRLSDMFRLRIGAEVGFGQCVPEVEPRTWCAKFGGAGGLVIGGR